MIYRNRLLTAFQDGLLTIGATLHANYFTALVDHEQVDDPHVPGTFGSKVLGLIVTSKQLFKR